MSTQTKVSIARLSIISNTLLIILKTMVGLLTGSVSILSEAIHSFMDLLASIIAFFSVKVSDTPPDSRHPYGHGKIENLSGVLEAILIFVAAIWIIYEAVHKLIYPGSEVTMIGWGALVMFISAIVNTLVSRKLYKVAKATDSIALEADALHLKADVYTSLGVAIAMLLIWLTDIHILDPIVALLVALFILREAFSLFQKAFMPMLDVAWDTDSLTLLDQQLVAMNIDCQDVKTRKAGSYHFVEFNLMVEPHSTVQESHDLCDKIENQLESVFSNAIITIHVEPKKPINDD